MAATLTRTALRASTSRLSTTHSSFAARQASPIFRRFLATPRGEQPRLRIGSEAPNFQAKTTNGDIDFHQWPIYATITADDLRLGKLDNKWAILFSHPADFTPVCTTELGAFAKLKDEFERRGVQMIGLSANDLSSHSSWVNDINALSKTTLTFPIIADASRSVAWLYDMISTPTSKNSPARAA
ncbi:hypothetical protein LTR54_005134 [Friedmanniomyces endolithicus]|nr:hypothetical protein LTR54_005134 [Friedmanniomyces endolithicus]